MKKSVLVLIFVAGTAVGFAVCKALVPQAAEPEAKVEKSVAPEDAEKLAKAQKRIVALEKKLAVAKAAKKPEMPKDEAASGNETRKIVVNDGDDVLESLRKNLS